MIEPQTPKSKRPAARKAVSPILFFLDASGAQIVSVNPDGSDKKVIVTAAGPIPDGIVVDAEAGHIYWTNMGNPIKNAGSIERVELDGNNGTAIVPGGATFTPKQRHLQSARAKL